MCVEINSVVSFQYMKFLLETLFFFFRQKFVCNYYCIEDLEYVRTGCLMSRRICMCLLLTLLKSSCRNHNNSMLPLK